MYLFLEKGDLLVSAVNNAPAIFVDSENIANIHNLYGMDENKLRQLYVLPAESLYRLKPTLLKLPIIADQNKEIIQHNTG